MAEPKVIPRRKERSGVQRYRWTRQQYEQMVEAGVLTTDDRVELIDGEILEMSPQKSLHATAILLLMNVLQEAYPTGYVVRPQLPLALGADSEPEPDLAVVAGEVLDYLDTHPTSALLVVEVSDATLAMDRRRKTALYARHLIPEYWIVNLHDECLEVYRGPAGGTYATKITLYRGDAIQPPEARERIAVGRCLPPGKSGEA